MGKEWLNLIPYNWGRENYIDVFKDFKRTSDITLENATISEWFEIERNGVAPDAYSFGVIKKADELLADSFKDEPWENQYYLSGPGRFNDPDLWKHPEAVTNHFRIFYSVVQAGIPICFADYYYLAKGFFFFYVRPADWYFDNTAYDRKRHLKSVVSLRTAALIRDVEHLFGGIYLTREQFFQKIENLNQHSVFCLSSVSNRIGRFRDALAYDEHMLLEYYEVRKKREFHDFYYSYSEQSAVDVKTEKYVRKSLSGIGTAEGIYTALTHTLPFYSRNSFEESSNKKLFSSVARLFYRSVINFVFDNYVNSVLKRMQRSYWVYRNVSVKTEKINALTAEEKRKILSSNYNASRYLPNRFWKCINNIDSGLCDGFVLFESVRYLYHYLSVCKIGGDDLHFYSAKLSKTDEKLGFYFDNAVLALTMGKYDELCLLVRQFIEWWIQYNGIESDTQSDGFIRDSIKKLPGRKRSAFLTANDISAKGLHLRSWRNTSNKTDAWNDIPVHSLFTCFIEMIWDTANEIRKVKKRQPFDFVIPSNLIYIDYDFPREYMNDTMDFPSYIAEQIGYDIATENDALAAMNIRRAMELYYDSVIHDNRTLFSGDYEITGNESFSQKLSICKSVARAHELNWNMGDAVILKNECNALIHSEKSFLRTDIDSYLNNVFKSGFNRNRLRGYNAGKAEKDAEEQFISEFFEYELIKKSEPSVSTGNPYPVNAYNTSNQNYRPQYGAPNREKKPDKISRFFVVLGLVFLFLMLLPIFLEAC